MPASKVDPATGAELFKMSDAASSKNSEGVRERWSESADSSLGVPDDEGAMDDLRIRVDAARLASQRSAPSSAVSAASSGTVGAEWNMVDQPRRPKRKGTSDVSHTSNASRSSTNVSRASAFLKRPSQT